MLCFGSIGIMLCLGSIGLECVISELRFKGEILQSNYRKMTISYNSFVNFKDKKVWDSQHDHVIFRPVL